MDRVFPWRLDFRPRPVAGGRLDCHRRAWRSFSNTLGMRGRFVGDAPGYGVSGAHHLPPYRGSVFCAGGEGFGIGLLSGLAYALLAGWSPSMRHLTMPTVEVLQVIPGLAWIPVAILLFGLNQTATVTIITLTTFPAVAIAGVMGVRSVDARYVRAARMCGAGPWALFATVFLPGALPHLLSGPAHRAWSRLAGPCGGGNDRRVRRRTRLCHHPVALDHGLCLGLCLHRHHRHAWPGPGTVAPVATGAPDRGALGIKP